MARLQGDYGNLVHGVSQQPDERKAKGQCIEQVNGRSNLVRGFERRAGFMYVGDLDPDGVDLTGAKWTSQERGDGVANIIAYADQTPVIFDLNAITQQFTFLGDAEDYYQGPVPPTERFGVTPILDTTYITNRGVVPLGDDENDTIGSFPQIAWLRFRTFSPGTEVLIESVGLAYEYVVFDGFVSVSGDGVPDPDEKLRTREYEGSYHADAFANGFPEGEGPGDDTGAVTSPALGDAYNNWVRVLASDLTSLEVKGGGDSIEIFYNNDINAIEQLPPVAKTGDLVRIVEGQGEDRNTGYFIATLKDEDAVEGSLGPVSWAETTSAGSSGTLDETTMPHRILRDISGNFTMQAIPWLERQVGDADSSSYPSFILDGTPIQDIGLFQNRIYLTANETIHFTATDHYEDFWTASAFYNTDADPFEVFADTNELNIIKYAEQFDGDLVFFSDNGQFLLSGEETHTYQSSLIQSVAQYKADLTSDPVLSGDNIFFATDYGSYAGVREFYTDNFSDTKRARPVTDHVETYMEGNIRHMATSTNVDALICLTDKRNQAFIYEWRWEGQEKAQSAWGRWELEGEFEFEWINFIGSKLYAVVSHMTLGWQLWVMDWDDPAETHGLNYAVRTDGRFEVPVTGYDPVAGASYWTVGGGVTGTYDHEALLFVEGPESEDAGFVVDAGRLNDGLWIALGDLSGVTLIAGLPYETSYEVPTPMIRDKDGVAQTLERFQVGQLACHFSTVGQVEFTISDNHANTRTISYFNNRRMNNLNNQASVVNVDADTWKFPVRKKTDGLALRMHTRDVTPFTVRAIEWLGEYKQKGRRT